MTDTEWLELGEACHVRLSELSAILLWEAEQFGCDETLLADARALHRAKRPYDALRRVLDTVPPDTPWGPHACIGRRVHNAFVRRTVWEPPSLEMAWGLRRGYPVLLESLRRAANELDART